jgi:hypothetical protein
MRSSTTVEKRDSSWPDDPVITVERSVEVYRNPRPELVARHAWHPSLIRLCHDEWLCSFDIGQGPEAHDYVSYASRSTDRGSTWSDPAPMFAVEPAPRATHTVRVTRLRDGSLLGFGARFIRSDPNQGLINHPGLGYCDCELISTRSRDGGLTWSGPSVVAPPLDAPAFETCHAPVELADGRIILPTSTWIGWDGAGAEGMRAVAFISHDRGDTWRSHLDEFDRWANGIVSWEQSIAELGDGRLLAVVWSLDTRTGTTLPTTYAVAPPNGIFGDARENGIVAQTMKLASLGGDRVLAVYRRHDEPGLWASTARIGPTWVTEQTHPLWLGASSGMVGEMAVGTALSALQFGYPSIAVENDQSAVVAFWCKESDIYGIRALWLELT